MKNSSIHAGASLALLAALALAPFSSHAQIDIELDASATSSVETDNDTSTSSDSLIDIDLEATTTTEVDNDSAETEGLRINAEGIAVAVSEEVRSDADLEVFAANVSIREDKVDEVTFDSEVTGAWETRVVYAHEGKLFGLMPVTVKSTTVVEVDANGELHVDSNLPWWNFMVTEKNHAEAEIESRLRDNATVMAAAEVEANAAVKAQVVEAIVAELNAHTYIQAAINAR